MTPIRFRDNSRATVSTLSRVMVSTAAWLASAGQTQFRLRQAGLTFHSEAYDVLIVSGAEARFGGSGRVEGDGGFSFRATVVDGDLAGDGIDRFRLEIWHTANGTVVYDSQPGDPDTAPATTPLGGGNITIHTQ